MIFHCCAHKSHILAIRSGSLAAILGYLGAWIWVDFGAARVVPGAPEAQLSSRYNCGIFYALSFFNASSCEPLLINSCESRDFDFKGFVSQESCYTSMG